MAERLIGKGMNLKIFDRRSNLSRISGANRRYIETTIPHIGSLMLDRCEEVIERSEVIVAGLPDKRIMEILYSSCRNGPHDHRPRRNGRRR